MTVEHEDEGLVVGTAMTIHNGARPNRPSRKGVSCIFGKLI